MIAMQSTDWAPKKKPKHLLDQINDVLFVAAYIAAFAAGVRQIDVAKKAAAENHPQNSDVVALLLAVKFCKLPKTATTFARQRNFYNGVLFFGVLTA